MCLVFPPSVSPSWLIRLHVQDGGGILMISVDLYVYLWLRFANITRLWEQTLPHSSLSQCVAPWLTFESEVAQSCLTLCDPMDCSLPSMGFSRQEYWSGLSFPSPGDLPDPGIEPGSPEFQADALTSEPPGKPPLRHTLSLFFSKISVAFVGNPWV